MRVYTVRYHLHPVTTVGVFAAILE